LRVSPFHAEGEGINDAMIRATIDEYLDIVSRSWGI